MHSFPISTIFNVAIRSFFSLGKAFSSFLYYSCISQSIDIHDMVYEAVASQLDFSWAFEFVDLSFDFY
jgi:hypothetical protein